MERQWYAHEEAQDTSRSALLLSQQTHCGTERWNGNGTHMKRPRIHAEVHFLYVNKHIEELKDGTAIVRT